MTDHGIKIGRCYAACKRCGKPLHYGDCAVTDPIGTAQERELIERMNAEQVLVADQEPFVEIWETDFKQLLSVVQSRIAEVAELRELLKDARHKVKIYSGINGKAVQHWERNLIDKIDAALSLQRRV